MVFLHIIGGLLSLTSGAVALSVSKGSRLHRRSGTIFVYAMLLMSASGAWMASLMPEWTSVIAGWLTFYLVATALLTVRRPREGSRWLDTAGMVFALGIGLFSIAYSSAGRGDGMAPIGFIFGAVALLAAVGDARMLLAQSLPWKERIVRHLWRMCFALWIATASFFLGQADEFPEAMRIMPLLCTPVLLVMLVMFYWTARVWFTQWHPNV